MPQTQAQRPTPAPESFLEAVLRRDRALVMGGLALVTVLAWAYLLGLAATMDDMSGTAMGATSVATSMSPQLRAWTGRDFVFMFLMWAVMMVAMMVPSASPMILLHAKVNRQQGDAGGAGLGTVAFTLGYLLAWTGFSAVATLLQWVLERLALLSPMMASTSVLLGAVVLLAAGIYQLTPIKAACLEHCRSPLHFVMHHWRRGTRGALVMGLDHGIYCIGCCWFLMALLFVGGVMNLLWIAGLTVLVLLEKVVPRGELVARTAGVGLLAAGVFLLVRAF